MKIRKTEGDSVVDYLLIDDENNNLVIGQIRRIRGSWTVEFYDDIQLTVDDLIDVAKALKGIKL